MNSGFEWKDDLQGWFDMFYDGKLLCSVAKQNILGNQFFNTSWRAISWGGGHSTDTNHIIKARTLDDAKKQLEDMAVLWILEGKTS